MTKNIADSRRQLLHRVHTEGVWHAYQAAEDVCRDKTAPAPARATAAATLFRVAGYFITKSDEDADRKPLHEMSLAELHERILRLRSEHSEFEATDASEASRDSDGETSVFD